MNRKEKELFVYVGYMELEDLDDPADLEKLKGEIEAMSDKKLDLEVRWSDHLLNK